MLTLTMVCTPGGGVKNFRKVFAGGWVKNIYFGIMGGSYIVGGRVILLVVGSGNFEVKIKIV